VADFSIEAVDHDIEGRHDEYGAAIGLRHINVPSPLDFTTRARLEYLMTFKGIYIHDYLAEGRSGSVLRLDQEMVRPLVGRTESRAV